MTHGGLFIMPSSRKDPLVQSRAIVPTLTVDDLQKSISFYEALGFAIDERWEEQGTLRGEHVAWVPGPDA